MLDIAPDHPIDGRVACRDLIPLQLSLPNEPLLPVRRALHCSLFSHDHLFLRPTHSRQKRRLDETNARTSGLARLNNPQAKAVAADNSVPDNPDQWRPRSYLGRAGECGSMIPALAKRSGAARDRHSNLASVTWMLVKNIP